MNFIEKIIFLTLGVFFAVILVYNISQYMSHMKETFAFINPYPPNASGLKEDEEDDAFFKQMNAEYNPNAGDEIANMGEELDKEVVLSPKETDFIDEEDIELPDYLK